MKNIILTFTMLATTTEVFAEFPDLKNFDHDIVYTDYKEKTYTHKRADCLQLYQKKEDSGTCYEGFDKVTKCVFNVVIDPAPLCTIKDEEKNIFHSVSCKELNKNGIKVLLFSFRNEGREHRFTFSTCDFFSIGMFQSFDGHSL